VDYGPQAPYAAGNKENQNNNKKADVRVP